MSEFCVIFVTLPDTTTARKIADVVVSEKLCACASFSDGHTSVFSWKGKHETASETLMIIKTHASLLEKLEARVRAMHPYEVFEFVALPVLYGNQQYLDWIREVVS